MQRTLVMIRHAKSSWANPLQSDFERPLNERGEQDAPLMGKRLKERNIIPDLIISSTAKRARQTAKRIAGSIGYDKDRIMALDKLYHCVPAVIAEVVTEISDEIHTVFIIAHNPGITEFVNEQSEKFKTDNMPTCAAAAIRTEAGSWGDFSMEEKEVFLFEYPKKLYDK